MITDWK